MVEKILMIALSPTMESGQIVRWNKKVGDFITSGDLLCEVETDKATMEYEATNEGTLLKILLLEGGTALIGEAIALVGDEGEDISNVLIESSATKTTDIPQNELNQVNDKSSSDKVKASPLARKIALEQNIDINNITGSGPNGRIIKRDIEKHFVEEPKRELGNTNLSTVQQDKNIPITQKRRIIANRLSESKYSAPHYYLTLTTKMDKLLSARKMINSVLEKKVSFNSFLIKFIAETLKKHLMVNSTWNDDKIIMHARIDIGMAVALSDGLITPVVRDCGNKSIKIIDEELKKLIEKARDNKLLPEEYSEATFTISSLGSFGIEEFTAIINPPGSAILAIGEIQKKPVVGEADQIVIRSIMKLTLSCDHRVIDGVVGARFLKDLKQILEEPILGLY